MAKYAGPLLDDDDLDSAAATEWYARNAAWITTLIGLIAVGFAGWYIFQSYRDRGNEQRTAKLTELMVQFEVALQDTDTTSRANLLRTLSSSALFQANELGNHRIALQALLIAGNAQYELGLTLAGEEGVKALRDALPLYDQFVSRSQSNEDKAIGILARANTLDNIAFLSGDVQAATEASRAYGEVSRMAPRSALDLEARLGAARLLAAQPGREDEARKLLDSVVEESRRTAQGGLAGQLRADDPVTTLTVTTQQGQREVSQADIVNLRSLSQASLGAKAQELLKRLPAIVSTTTTTKIISNN